MWGLWLRAQEGYAAPAARKQCNWRAPLLWILNNTVALMTMSWTGGRRVPRDQGAKTVSMCSLNQHGPPTHLPCQSILNTGIHTFYTLCIINASNANQSNLEYWAEFLAHSLWHRTMHFLKVEWHFLTVEIWNFLTVEIWNYLKVEILLFFTVEIWNFLTVDTLYIHEEIFGQESSNHTTSY